MKLALGTAFAVVAWSAASFQARETPAKLFSEDESRRVIAYWAEAGRYRVEPLPDAARNGPWQVRSTPEGSLWLWNYDRARGLPKVPPGSKPTPLTPEQRRWEAWIDAKVARDNWEASLKAEDLNAAVLGKSPKAPSRPEPRLPGPIPPALLALAGEPPAFAAPVVPQRYVVVFDDAEIAYTDNPSMRPRYAYYRFPQGVMHVGEKVRDLPPKELEALFEEAGVSPSERKVMAAVSPLEGGFDSVNTYDTGFVSVGFLQFACLSAGAGSLGQVLLKFKSLDPEGFHKEFRTFGLDVTPDGRLAALDPATGAELYGPDAASKIIEDKRLTAVFQRAGQKSRAFRLAQIAVAKERYYPANDPITLVVGDAVLSGKVSDFVKSEAAMAILMDRKVNTGKLEELPEVLSYCAELSGARSLSELARYERDIAALMVYRKDYLSDPSLSQPGPALLARRHVEEILSRRAARNSRRPPG